MSVEILGQSTRIHGSRVSYCTPVRFLVHWSLGAINFDNENALVDLTERKVKIVKQKRTFKLHYNILISTNICYIHDTRHNLQIDYVKKIYQNYTENGLDIAPKMKIITHLEDKVS